MSKLSSTFYKWLAFGLGIIAVLAMFLPFMTDEYLADRNATSFFWDVGSDKGAWPTFVGFMLILAGALVTGVLATPFVELSEKSEKIVSISAAVAMGIGVILVGFLQVMYAGFNGFKTGWTLADFTYLAGFYISVIAGALATGASVVAIIKE